MRTLKKCLKYELKMVKLDIAHCEEMIRSEVSTYYEKVWEKRKRNDEKYRDELIAELEIINNRNT